MKSTIYFYFLWIFLALVFVRCSNDNNTKSEIIQYPISLEEVQEEAIQISIKENLPLLQEEESEFILPPEPEPEPEPPPPPEPEPFIFIPKERMEQKWKRIAHSSRAEAWRDDSEFCLAYGDTLVQRGQYREATMAYEKADELGSIYNGKACFGLARVRALENPHDYYRIRKYLKRAIDRGFKDYKAILYSKDFKRYREENYFLYSYCEQFKNNQAALFEAFIAYAPQQNLTEAYDLSPVNLFEDIGARRTKNARIYTGFNRFAEGAKENSFGRFTSGNCRYELCLTAKNYRVVIYSIEEQWSDYILSKKYYLLTYDLEGNKISELEIAKRGSLKTCKGFVLHPDNSLVVTKYAIKWKMGAKSSLKMNGFLNYKHLKKAIVKSTQAYQITNSGRLLEMEDLLVLK